MFGVFTFGVANIIQANDLCTLVVALGEIIVSKILGISVTYASPISLPSDIMPGCTCCLHSIIQTLWTTKLTLLWSGIEEDKHKPCCNPKEI